MSLALPKSLVRDPQNIRLAMLGMVEGNGHPYSWSAIINGRYDAAAMAECGYPVIPQYLGAQPAGALGIPGARVSHVWCDRREDAERVAKAAFIEHVADRPEGVIGHVDAVVIATDIGGEHVARARPFIDAGLPVFIDKPLTDNEADLRTFAELYRGGRPILSTSCMRYADEFTLLRERMGDIGEPRLIVATMMKSWERYGIHAVESVYGLLPPGGWLDAASTGEPGREVVHLRHALGVDVVIAVIRDLTGGFGHVELLGTKGRLDARFADTFSAFKAQLVAFVDFLRTGQAPFSHTQTIEQMKIIIAAIRSREAGGHRVGLEEIRA